MGRQYRGIRAAASALLVAAAVGTGGMVGMTSALASAPGMVDLSGTVVDGSGVPLAGVHLVVAEELPPDGGFTAVQTTTATDGSFTAEVFAWGTVDAPATLTIRTAPDETIEVVGATCSQTWAVMVLDERQVVLADLAADAALDALALTASTSLLGEACGTTGTPPDGPAAGAGQPGLTPPPTDTLARPLVGTPDRLGPALWIGFAIGLVAACAFLLPRPGARGRD